MNKLLTTEQKLNVINQRFRRGSKSYHAARYIVQHEGDIDQNAKDIIAKEVGLASTSLDGVFNKLRKLKLYGVPMQLEVTEQVNPQQQEAGNKLIQNQPPNTRIPPPMRENIPYNQVNPQQQEVPFEVAQHEQYVTYDDFETLKSELNTNFQKLVSALNDETPEEEQEGYLHDGYQPQDNPQEMTVEDPSLMRKTIWFKPKATMFYDLAKQGLFHTYVGTSDVGPLSGFNGNLSDFINIVIDDYFVRNFNADIGLLMRRYV